MAQYSYNPDWASAIASMESAGSGGYSAIGAPNSRGSRAYGRYQVMDFNIPDWTERYVGKRLTPEEFLNSPEAQDAVFQGQFGSLVQRYGNERDAASAWFTGRPVSAAGSDTDVHGRYTGASYADAFQKALGNPNVINAGIGSDALVALGKAPAAGQSQPGVLAAGAKPMAMMDTQPQGLLERMGLQRMDPNAQGETAMPFYQRPSFLDFAKGLGLGLSQLSTRPSQAAAQQLAQLQQDRSQRRAANQTLAWLASQPGGEQFMPLVEAIGAAGALQAYFEAMKGDNVVVGGNIVNRNTGEIVFSAPTSVDPQSAIAKLTADLRNGLITQDQYDLAVANMAPPNTSVEVGPDGTVRFVQGAGAGMPKLTEAQGKATGFFAKASEANEILSQIEEEGTDLYNSLARNIPLAGNYMISEEYQQYLQAKRNFINAILRQESGAAIAASEFENAEQQYFPQPGDSPAVIEQKRRNRETAAAALGFASGPGAAALGADRPTAAVSGSGGFAVTGQVGQ